MHPVHPGKVVHPQLSWVIPHLLVTLHLLVVMRHSLVMLPFLLMPRKRMDVISAAWLRPGNEDCKTAQVQDSSNKGRGRHDFDSIAKYIPQGSNIQSTGLKPITYVKHVGFLLGTGCLLVCPPMGAAAVFVAGAGSCWIMKFADESGILYTVYLYWITFLYFIFACGILVFLACQSRYLRLVTTATSNFVFPLF